MRRRLYWMLPDVASARRMVDDMLLARVEERHLHFVAREGTEGRPGPALTDGPDSRDPLSAHATAGRTTIPTPTPNATARAPTRPTDRASHTGGDCRAGRDSAQPTGGILTTTARRPSREHSGARIPPARQIAFDHQLTRTSGNLPPVGYPGPTRRHRNHGLRRHHSTYP